MQLPDQSELIGNALNGAYHDEGKTLTVSLDSAPEDGALTLDEDGAFVYRPEEGFVGFDEFTCVVSTVDGQESQMATVVVNVLPGIEPLVGPMAEPVDERLAISGPLTTLGKAYATGLDVDGSDVLAASTSRVSRPSRSATSSRSATRRRPGTRASRASRRPVARRRPISTR